MMMGKTIKTITIFKKSQSWSKSVGKPTSSEGQEQTEEIGRGLGTRSPGLWSHLVVVQILSLYGLQSVKGGAGPYQQFLNTGLSASGSPRLLIYYIDGQAHVNC